MGSPCSCSPTSAVRRPRLPWVERAARFTARAKRSTGSSVKGSTTKERRNSRTSSAAHRTRSASSCSPSRTYEVSPCVTANSSWATSAVRRATTSPEERSSSVRAGTHTRWANTSARKAASTRWPTDCIHPVWRNCASAFTRAAAITAAGSTQRQTEACSSTGPSCTAPPNRTPLRSGPTSQA